MSENDIDCYLNEEKWGLIDCEWTFDRSIETKEIAFRALYCYLLEDEKRNGLNSDLIMDKLKIEPAEAEQYRRQEMKFQKYVTGKRLSMAEIRRRSVSLFIRWKISVKDREISLRTTAYRFTRIQGKAFWRSSPFSRRRMENRFCAPGKERWSLPCVLREDGVRCGSIPAAMPV